MKSKIVSLLTVMLASTVCAARASECDVHFYAAYVLARSSGLTAHASLLIARASQSMDENAETSPLPDLRYLPNKKYPSSALLGGWIPTLFDYQSRGTKWHSLPSWWNFRDYIPIDLKRDIAAHDAYEVQKRLNELYQRAINVDKNDDWTSEVYFGEYLHALADSVTHKGYENLIGHIRDGKTPDIPNPDKPEPTREILRLMVRGVASLA